MARCKDCIHEIVCSALIEKGLPWNDGEYPAEAFCLAFRNKADVVPKSEVEELKAIIADHKANEERWQELYADTVNKWEEAYEKLEIQLDNAKSEVAREIFEEIEGCFMFGERIYSIDKPTFAELKKKYTEEKE